MKKITFIFLLILCYSFLYSQAREKLPAVQVPKFKKDTANILKYGAIADGYTLNTKSIHEAMNALHRKGGGVVFVPAVYPRNCLRSMIFD